MDFESYRKQLDVLTQQGLSVNLTRGKPNTEQVSLADRLDGILDGDFIAEDGTDVRDYGGIRGIPEARRIGAFLMDVPDAQVIAAGNSSLQLMHIVVDAAINKGIAADPLKSYPSVEAICPVPGYDRHFAVMESFDVPMYCVQIDEVGPDVEAIESRLKSIDGAAFLWCVPKHSNPTGCTYSDEVVERIAAFPKINDATYILWDNAYSVHDFKSGAPKLASIYDAAVRQGTSDRVVLFSSTSKITFAGGGVAFVGGSDAVLNDIESHLASMTIGFDKVNQLRHARLLQDGEHIRAHMRKHAAILAPRFEIVQRGLEEHLGNTGLATWTNPSGGYFVSLDLKPGLARDVVQLAQTAGLALTPAGATFPYGNDPNDSNVRIAPTYATTNEIESAMEILGVCVKLAAAREGQ